MIRDKSVEEISDGRLYRAGDLVKIGTNGCQGCCDCCRMDALIVLDPWDIWQLKCGLGLDLKDLLDRTVSLEVIDGLIQPALKMKDGVCPYLGSDGRCRIHAFRPGICRLYPLGRSWKGEDFSYILQVEECTHCTGTKVKVKKWLGVEDLPRYEEYCRTWHAFLSKAREACDRGGDRVRKAVCMQILQTCYLTAYDPDRVFYGQFGDALGLAAHSIGMAPMDHRI